MCATRVGDAEHRATGAAAVVAAVADSGDFRPDTKGGGGVRHSQSRPLSRCQRRDRDDRG